MSNEGYTYIQEVVNEVAEIQAPTDIDPDNTDLNGSEVRRSLSDGANRAVDDLEEIIEGVRITREGRIHQKDKRILTSAGLDVLEKHDPEQPDMVMIEVGVQTTEEKSMPDNYGVHKVTVVRSIGY